MVTILLISVGAFLLLGFMFGVKPWKSLASVDVFYVCIYKFKCCACASMNIHTHIHIYFQIYCFFFSLSLWVECECLKRIWFHRCLRLWALVQFCLRTYVCMCACAYGRRFNLCLIKVWIYRVYIDIISPIDIFFYIFHEIFIFL